MLKTVRCFWLNVELFREDQLLSQKKWALSGGFLDRDETTIEACRREVKEELNIEISNLKLIHIVDNPNRPNEDRQNVNFVFVADFAGGEIKTNEEVIEVRWFNLDDFPPKDAIAFDFYDELLFYERYLREDFAVPVIN